MTARRGERAGVVWLHGVIGWGLSAALLWSVAMWLTRAGANLGENFLVALMLFPVAGYVAGRMMWQDRLHAEGGGERSSSRADALACAGPRVATVEAATRELAPSWSRITQVWWALTWRSGVAMLISLLVGALLGGVASLVFRAAGSPPQISSGFAQLLGASLGLVGSIVPVKLIVGKNFGEFRLVLLAPRPQPPEAPSGEGSVTPTDASEKPPSTDAVSGGSRPTP